MAIRLMRCWASTFIRAGYLPSISLKKSLKCTFTNPKLLNESAENIYHPVCAAGLPGYQWCIAAKERYGIIARSFDPGDRLAFATRQDRQHPESCGHHSWQG